jgi:hypothetical protein
MMKAFHTVAVPHQDILEGRPKRGKATSDLLLEWPEFR